ncbi:MAG: hypothetical protein HY060_26995 [Proteobacteria bacterium]|nr:hypothetical protein [Pseudomonadota bacterium]
MFAHPTAVHLFRCTNSQIRYAATLDPTGANLPGPLCPNGSWQTFATILVTPGERPRIGLDADAMAKALQEHGYFVWEAGAIAQVFPAVPTP